MIKQMRESGYCTLYSFVLLLQLLHHSSPDLLNFISILLWIFHTLASVYYPAGGGDSTVLHVQHFLKLSAYSTIFIDIRQSRTIFVYLFGIFIIWISSDDYVLSCTLNFKSGIIVVAIVLLKYKSKQFHQLNIQLFSEYEGPRL